MIRQALERDIDAINNIYNELLYYEQEHGSYTNWQMGIYPTRAVAERTVAAGTMYVLEESGEICAGMILNSIQAPEYANVAWEFEAAPDKVLVVHTLCVPPSKSGKGYGRKMMEFAVDHARRGGFEVMRFDTFVGNEPARRFYTQNGFKIAGVIDVLHEGLIQEELVCFECRL